MTKKDWSTALQAAKQVCADLKKSGMDVELSEEDEARNDAIQECIFEIILLEERKP